MSIFEITSSIPHCICWPGTMVYLDTKMYFKFQISSFITQPYPKYTIYFIGNPKVVELLIANCASLNVRNTNNDQTALHLAAQKGKSIEK